MTVEEIDCYWMANAKGVDHALHYAKMWSKVVRNRIQNVILAANSNVNLFLLLPKYAKEVITYVDKRASLELEMARGLSKLAQSTRPALR